MAMTADEAFRQAVLAGDLAEVRRALAAGADVDVVVGEKRGQRQTSGDVGPDGFTALHVAAYHDDRELCELLLERRADALARTRFGATPLDLAVQFGSPAAARALLGAGVDPNGPPGLVVAAAGRADLEMLRLLLAHGARRGLERALSAACGWQGSVEVLRVVIDAGAEPAPGGPEDWSPRVVALDRRRFDCLALLRESFRPERLIDAVIDGDRGEVERHLGAGAKVDEPLRHGITALASAARMGHREIAERLIEAGAAVDRKTLWGTPVFCALVQGHLELASALHSRGASLSGLHVGLINARADTEALAWICSRRPPERLEVVLCSAIAVGNRAMVEMLLSIGADPNGLDAWGRSALCLAVAANRVEIAVCLLDAGADPRARDPRGHPITHYLLTYDDVTEDWLDPDYDPSRYARDSPALRTEAARLILERGAPLPWDDDG